MIRRLYLLGFLAAALCVLGCIACAALGSPYGAIACADLAVLLAFISSRERDAFLNDEDWRHATRPIIRL